MPRRHLPLIAALLLSATLACQPTASNDPPVEAQADVAPEPPPAPPDPAPALVDAWLPGLDARLRAIAIEQDILRALDKEARQVVAQSNDRFLYRSILRRLFVRNEAPRLVFVPGGEFTERSQTILKYLKSMGHHGLDIRDDYHTRVIQTKLGELEALKDDFASTGEPLEVTTAERGALEELARGMITEGAIDPEKPEEAFAALTRELVNREAAPVASALKRLKGYRRDWPDRVELLMEIEARMVDGVSRYAWDMRYHNHHWFDPEPFEKVRWRERRRLLLGYLRDGMVEAFKREDLFPWMQSLIPPHPQYARLIEALARYRRYYAAGGWPKFSKVPGLRQGIRHEAVPALKKRLAAEEYYPPPGHEAPEEFDEQYGEDLEESVRWYQRTHQMEVTGRPHKIFWQSLEVSAKKRVQYIKVALERWRESSITDPKGYYVFVNIPDFHLEVWRDGDRLMRFKTIVGNPYWGCDIRSGMWVRINQTPIQSGAIDTIVLNPWWAVPERILREEVMPRAEQDPSYLEANGFQCLERDKDTCVRMRQATGKENALGRVKFLFPSPHNTYLHDTPKKHFFELPIRAMSHGCVRLEKPLELARMLLQQDGQWDEEEFQRRHDRKREFDLKLNRPVPIHVGYHSVRVDDSGDVHFLIDVYKHDHFRRIGEAFEPRKCTPEELKNAVDPTIDDGLE